MEAIAIDNFDIWQIAESGECFRMDMIAGSPRKVIAIAGDKAVEIEQDEGSSEVRFSCDREEYDTFWAHYFDLETPYGSFCSAVPADDENLLAAVECGSGIRILWQDPWEASVSFVISQNCNIPRIRSNIEALCEALGEQREASFSSGIYRYRAFPTPEAVASAGDETLRAVGLGYRAPYVSSLAREVASGVLSFEELQRCADGRAVHERLLTLEGVGPKVASCIELFGLHRLDAFPVDTWMRKVEDAWYDGRFPRERYAGFEGVMQQYLFHYARVQGLGTRG